MRTLSFLLLVALALAMSGCSGKDSVDPRLEWLPDLGSEFVLATQGDSMRADLDHYGMATNPGEADRAKFPAQDSANAPKEAYGGMYFSESRAGFQVYAFVLDFEDLAALDGYMDERDDCGKGAAFFAWMSDGTRALFVSAFSIYGNELPADMIENFEDAIADLETEDRHLICTNQA